MRQSSPSRLSSSSRQDETHVVNIPNQPDSPHASSAQNIHDFQEQKSATSIIFNTLKPKDGEAAIKLIKKHQRNKINSVLDAGCSEGAMLPYIAQLEHDITIHRNDPVKDRVDEYTKRIAHTPNTHVGEEIIGKMEDVELPKADLTLVSHSLYYNTSFWKAPRHPQESSQQPLLKKLLDTLNLNGLLCVILQANEPTGIPAIHSERQFIANLEEFEDAIYPLIQKSSNLNQRSYANAKIFRRALKYYKEHYEPTLSYYKSAPIIVPIKLGDINFQPNEAGLYPQSEAVTDYLNFYTRGCYHDPKKERQMTGEQQKQVLDFIQNNCHSTEGYRITHVNQAIVVMRNLPVHAQVEVHASQACSSSIS